jgi:hypothetical protein
VTTAGDDSDGIRGATFGAGSTLTIAAGDDSTTGADSNAITALGFGGPVAVSVHGDVSSAQANGVDVTAGTDATINVTAGGSVHGAVDSIAVDAPGATSITNAGTITTGSGYAIDVTGGPATVRNRGTISGRIALTGGDDTVTNSGNFIVHGDSDFGAGDDLFTNSGTVALAKTGARQNATLIGIERFNSSGLVSLSNGVVGDQLTLPGSFTGSGESALSVDVGGTSADRLNVGIAGGSTAVSLTSVGNVFLTPGVTIVQAGAASPAGAFHLATSSQGLINYHLRYDPDTFAYQLVGTPGATVFHALKATEGAQTLWYRSADAVNDHLDALRDGQWAAGNVGNGVWFQMYGGLDKRDEHKSYTTFGFTDQFNLNYKQDYFGAQGGIDFGSSGDNGGFTFGVTGGYINSTLRFSSNGDRFNYDDGNLGVYAGFNSGPLYVNALAKYDHYWIEANGPFAGFSDKFNGTSYGAQAEIGAKLGSDTLAFTPFGSAAYVRTDLNDLHALGQTLDFDQMDGLRAKGGLRVSSSSMTSGGSRMTFYASGAAVKEFKGKDGLTFVSGPASVSYRNDPIDLYGQAKIGMNVTSPGGVQGFIELQGDLSNKYKGGGAKAGIRVRF